MPMRLLKPILVAAIALGLSFPQATMSTNRPRSPTGYETELARIQKDIAELKEAALSTPIDIGKATRFVHRLYHRASLTGSAADLRITETAIDRAIQEIGPLADLYLLKANLDFGLHRLGKTSHGLSALSRFTGNAQVADLKARHTFHQDEYGEE